MSKVIKVNEGDYRVKVPNGHNITLDTGLTGSVFITGNLTIQGDTTTVESVNSTIADNIITLNSGETGNGITLNTAGILIDRGVDSALALSSSFIFDETISHYNPTNNTNDTGTFTLLTSRGLVNTYASLKLTSIELQTISSNGANGIGVNLKNTNTTIALVNSDYNGTSYESRVSDNSLVNKKYVTTYVVSGQETLGMADVDKIYFKNGTIKSKILATTSDLQFSINSNLRATINSSGLTVDTINLFGTTVTNTGSNPLVLTSGSANLVEVNSVLALDDQSNTPNSISNKTQIYSKAVVGSGKSGLFFVNTTTADELVAKNRALLFSMLF